MIGNRLATAWGLFLLAGCTASDDGRYSISGNVNIDGKPVPIGEISFEPDGKAGNIGPGSFAPIKDGKYVVDKESGIVGGKYTVTITGFDGVAFGEASDGKELLKRPHAEKLDLPKEDSTRDFDVKSKN